MMKQIVFISMCLFAFAPAHFGQRQTFDIISFTAPSGWKKEVSANAVQFGKEDAAKNAIGLIMIFRSVQAGNDSKTNFDASWEQIVASSFGKVNTPQMQPVGKDNGWKIESGVAQYDQNGNKGIVLLVSASGNGKVLNMLAVTNSEIFQPDITAFFESVKLPQVAEVNTRPANSANANVPAQLTRYLWRSSQSRKDGSGGSAGYSTNRYYFNADGTYQFTNETFQYHRPKYYLVNEEGVYRVNGNLITLTPNKSNYSSHALKKTEPPIRSGVFNTTTVQYTFEFTTIYDRLRLVLVPNTNAETTRDGVFNYFVNGELSRAYLYEAEDKQ